jgi:hypothetical protein
VDVTNGFGRKWKDFFQLLELRHGLTRTNDAHIWLLHHIFLPRINEDATIWAETWNNHVLSSRDHTHLTPAQKYVQGIVRHGNRGIFAPVVPEDPTEEDEEFWAGYGVDWQMMDDEGIMRHHQQNNTTQEDSEENPFEQGIPDWMSHVEVLDPRCPFDQSKITQLDEYLHSLPFYNLIDQPSRIELWRHGLSYSTYLAAPDTA